MKLHLGCGEMYLPGYVNIDLPPSQHTVQVTSRADVYADIANLTYSAGSIHEVRMHHVFEHFDRATALRLLVEWYEWLTDGGSVVIETPDFERCVTEFVRDADAVRRGTLVRHVFGSHEARWAAHLDGWYRAKFELTLSSLGYRDASFAPSEWNGTYNLTVWARKLQPFTTRDERLEACERLLRLSLIDDSETEERIHGVWMRRLQGFDRATAP